MTKKLSRLLVQRLASWRSTSA